MTLWENDIGTKIEFNVDLQIYCYHIWVSFGLHAKMLKKIRNNLGNLNVHKFVHEYTTVTWSFLSNIELFVLLCDFEYK